MRSLKIAGIERWPDLERDTLRIEQALTYAVDTCSFNVTGEQPSEGEEVVIEDASARLFAGIIVRVEMADKDLKLWQVDCDDYTALLDRRLVVETYENLPADEIFKDIVAKYCSGFTVNGVQSGAPVIESTGAEFEYKRPSECFRWLCDYVGWHWQPDYYKDLSFFSVDDLASPAPLELVPGGPFRFGKHSIDTQGLRNRVYVRGGTMLSDPQTIQWKADGVARIWTLPWGPHEVSLTVGEVPMTVGVENLHDEEDFDYMMSFSEKYIRCSAQTPTPVEGITMALTARQDIPVITMVEDYASQAAIAKVQGGDGIYEHVISDDSLISIAAAEAAGMADLREHGNPRVKGSFETEFSTPPEIVERLIDEAAVFTRTSKAYLSDGTQVAANVPRFEPGRFGQAVLVEEGTENLLMNPSFEGTFVSGVAPNWATYSTGSATGSYAESADALAGSKAQRITRTGGATSDRWGIRATSSAINATNATISVYIKVLSFTSGAVVRLYGDFTGGPYGVGQNYTIASGDVGKWIRLKGSATVDSTGTCTFYVWIEGANADILVDCAQVEAKPYATSFTDTTRSPETLTIPTAGVLNPQEGTIDLTYIPNHGTNRAGDRFILSAGINTTSNEFRVEYRTNDRWYLKVGDVAGEYITSLSANIPVVLAVRWDSSTVALFVNGSKVIQINAVFANLSLGDVLAIGSSVANWNWRYQCNGLIDDLRISSRALTDEEIAASYASGQPLPVDEHTTLKMPFNNSLDAFGCKIVHTYWQPGQIVDIRLPDRGVEGEYLIQRVTITPTWSNPSIWTFRADYGGRLLGIADFLKALVSAQQKKRVVEPTKNVQKYIYGEETLQISDELLTATRTLPFICGEPDAICGLVVASNG